MHRETDITGINPAYTLRKPTASILRRRRQPLQIRVRLSPLARLMQRIADLPAARLNLPPRLFPETDQQRHSRELHERREALIASTIPKGLPELIRRYCEHYVRIAVANHGRRALRTVVYPWTKRPVDPKEHPAARVRRGRLSNPTVRR